MNQLVRRVNQAPATIEDRDSLRPKSYRAGGILVSSDLSLDIDPKLHLSWAVVPRYWAKGYTLMVFRSETGFCPERYPEDLNRHGQLIIETNRDASHEERPPEGTYYYTFLLHKRGFLGLSEKLSILRFSETIPTAKIAIGRIKDQIELQEMLQRHEVGKIEQAAKLDEAELRRIQSRRKLEQVDSTPLKRKTMTAAEAVVADRLSEIDALVDTLMAKRQKIDELKKDLRFLKLNRNEKRTVLDKLEELLDAAEISVRREMRET